MLEERRLAEGEGFATKAPDCQGQVEFEITIEVELVARRLIVGKLGGQATLTSLARYYRGCLIAGSRELVLAEWRLLTRRNYFGCFCLCFL